MIKEVYSEKETRDFAYEMAQKAEVGQVYCLDGDLGVGKTVFTKGFAEGALDRCIEYTKERKQFGRSIAQQQNTQLKSSALYRS